MLQESKIKKDKKILINFKNQVNINFYLNIYEKFKKYINILLEKAQKCGDYI